jgi:hypothetical protein
VLANRSGLPRAAPVRDVVLPHQQRDQDGHDERRDAEQGQGQLPAERQEQRAAEHGDDDGARVAAADVDTDGEAAPARRIQVR